MKFLKQIAVLPALLLSAAAMAQVVVIANPAVGALNEQQIADLYLGKLTSATPYDQAEGSDIYATFYKSATGRDVAQVKSTWSRIVFSGKGTAPKQLPDSASVVKAVAADPKGVGYVDKASVTGAVKVLATFQ